MPETPERGGRQVVIAPSEDEALSLTCIRCGICCATYHVRVGRSEGQRIAGHLGMDFYDWVGRYCEPRWPDPRSYLIRHEPGGCVFLERQSDERFALCSIYPVRPDSCREWAAGPHKAACAEGLARFWAVQVDDRGRFVGESVAVQRVRDALRALTG